MGDFTTLAQRLEALEANVFGKVNLGDWSNDQDVPYWLAQIINPASLAVLKQVQFEQATIANAIQLIAQTKLTKDAAQAGILLSLTNEIIDDWCGTKVPGRHPHRLQAVLGELGRLADTYADKSIFREASFDLARRVLERAQEAGKQRALASA